MGIMGRVRGERATGFLEDVDKEGKDCYSNASNDVFKKQYPIGYALF